MSLRTIIESHVKQLDFADPKTQETIKNFIVKSIMCQYGEIYGWSMADTLMNLDSGPFLNCDMDDILDEIEDDD